MKLISIEGDSIHLQFEETELRILNNALNEVCNGLDIPGFEIRMGASHAEAQMLLSEISKGLRAIRKT